MMQLLGNLLSSPKRKHIDSPMAEGDVVDLCDTVSELEGRKAFAVFLTQVLTESECQALIQRAEEKGFEQALVNVGGGKQVKMDDVRNSGRCIIIDPSMAELVHQRIMAKLKDHPHLLNYLKDWELKGKLHAVGCNELFRLLQYEPGCYFKPHFDGCFVRRDEAGEDRRGELSQATILLYLNEGYKGGSTAFLNHEETAGYDVVPQTGSVLLFEHHCYHEGALLRKGCKYVARTEVMYTRKGPGHEYSEGFHLKTACEGKDTSMS